MRALPILLAAILCFRIIPGFYNLDGTQSFRVEQYPAWSTGAPDWETRLVGVRRPDEPWTVNIPVPAPNTLIWQVNGFGSMIVVDGGNLAVVQRRMGGMDDTCAWPGFRIHIPVIGG